MGIDTRYLESHVRPKIRSFRLLLSCKLCLKAHDSFDTGSKFITEYLTCQNENVKEYIKSQRSNFLGSVPRVTLSLVNFGNSFYWKPLFQHSRIIPPRIHIYIYIYWQFFLFFPVMFQSVNCFYFYVILLYIWDLPWLLFDKSYVVS